MGDTSGGGCGEVRGDQKQDTLVRDTKGTWPQVGLQRCISLCGLVRNGGQYYRRCVTGDFPRAPLEIQSGGFDWRSGNNMQVGIAAKIFGHFLRSPLNRKPDFARSQQRGADCSNLVAWKDSPKFIQNSWPVHEVRDLVATLVEGQTGRSIPAALTCSPTRIVCQDAIQSCVVWYCGVVLNRHSRIIARAGSQRLLPH